MDSAGLWAFGSDPARVRFGRFVCVMLGVGGWVGMAFLGRDLLARNPPAAGFDLELLLDAARRVASGTSPYDPNVMANGLNAHDLFYTYPPAVAQFLVPVSGLPTWIVLSAWCGGAVAGLAVVAALLARSSIGRPNADVAELPMDTALLAIAVTPLLLPFTVALLFGNADAWFPLLFGAVVLATTVPATIHAEGLSRPASIGAGAGLAISATAKLHPASLLVWLSARWTRGGPERRDIATVVVAAAATGVAILVLSVAIGGVGPWRDYVAYLMAGGHADLASAFNIGPASQLAMLAGDPGLAHPLALVWAVLAVVGSVVAGRLVRDPLESVAWAIVASLVLLPVTWYHYPVALLPVALAAWTRSRGAEGSRSVALWLLAAFLVADVSILLPVTLWLAVAALLGAVRRSRPPVFSVPSEHDGKGVGAASAQDLTATMPE